ncbi:MAG: alanine dehydrogenase [Myxococcales bacterium]|nr:alanine dehydrogenase [Myxococcales bacterium]MCB9717879.1 alanine dehydrogenase [Myxococcales bacterium]
MLIGVPKEIKTHEYRVGINPEGVRQLVAAGHQVKVQTGAGISSGFSDESFKEVGGTIAKDAADAWAADMVIKVKEPLPAEFGYFREGLVLYTYLHLAAFPELTRELLDKKVSGVAYETITDDSGALPLLRPMSEIAGRMASQVGAACLEREKGGKGLLLGGIPGTRRGHVVILGGGIVGTAAARIAIGLGGRVTVLDVNADRMLYLEDVFGNSIETLYSTPGTIEREVSRADLVIGAVLLPGGAAPKLVTREHLRAMEDGSVVVDVAVDQGGCIETCRPTTHDDPTFIEEGVVHYCVANMPGAVPQTSTTALTNATLPWALALAGQGVEAAARGSVHLARGLNTYKGACVCAPVAEAHGLDYTPLGDLL